MEHNVLILSTLTFNAKSNGKEYTRIDYIVIDKEFLGNNDHYYGYNVLSALVEGNYTSKIKDMKMLVNGNVKAEFKNTKDFKNPLNSQMRLAKLVLNNDSISLL